MEDMKTNFVEKIGNTVFIVNAMAASAAKHTQEELIRDLIADKAMKVDGDTD